MGSCENVKNSLICIQKKDLNVDQTVINHKNTEDTPKKSPGGGLTLVEVTNKENPSKENYFENKFLEELNSLRLSPDKYIDKINSAKKFIKIENNVTMINRENGIPVILKGGEESLDKAISFLKTQKKLEKLKWNNDLKVEFLANNKDSYETDILRALEKKSEEVKNKFNQCFFIVDYFEEIELNILFYLTEDDYNSYKRDIVFNENVSQFAVVYKKLDDRMFTAISVYA